MSNETRSVSGGAADAAPWYRTLPGWLRAVGARTVELLVYSTAYLVVAMLEAVLVIASLGLSWSLAPLVIGLLTFSVYAGDRIADVETVPASMALPELRSVAAGGPYTRYIVLDEDGEQPIGFVHAKDVLQASETETAPDTAVTARDLARDILVVPETRRIDAILAEFQSHGGGHIAVVIDEWGVFEGIVTLEDILEEIVGEIQDEFDPAAQTPAIEERADGTYVVDGGVPIHEVNDQLGTAFSTEEVETIGGFVFSALGREPEVGDQIERQRHVLRVDAIDNARIERLVIEPPARPRSESAEE